MAVHVLAVLAYKEGEAVTSGLLASSVNTNPVVIRRLLLALQAAGFIETRKGAGLGSRLARAPGRISLAEVYRAQGKTQLAQEELKKVAEIHETERTKLLHEISETPPAAPEP